MSTPPPSSGPSIVPLSVRPAVPEPGAVILGKYRVTKALASGGMGTVFAAHHLLLDQPIAIKCLAPNALESPAIIERFTREARAAARIASEHVVRIIDIGEFENGLPFIVMEYLEGEDLADHLARNGALRISTAVRFSLEACEVLAEAHGAGIIHRDIKPANLFIAKQRDKRRIIKVLDFGISKVTDEALTDASAMLGTLRYMSPEQLKSAKMVDHRTDIWALGAVLYEMLTGVPPFDDSNMATLIAAVFGNTRARVIDLRADIPEGLAAIVERCLETDPTRRFPTILDMARELTAFAKEDDRLSLETIRRILSATLPPDSTVPSSGPPRTQRVTDGSSTGGVTVVTVDQDATEMTDTLLSSFASPVSNDGEKSTSSGTIALAARPPSVDKAVPKEKAAPKDKPASKSSVSKQKVASKENAAPKEKAASKDKPTTERTRSSKDATNKSDPPEGQTSYARLAVIALVAAIVFALIGTVIERTVAPLPSPPHAPPAREAP